MSADGLGCLIAAVSSPHGHSFRGLLRATGEHLHEITAGIMRGEARQLLQERRRGVASGEILASLSGSAISIPCLVLSLPGPGSFTGEDSLEFELPGNPHLLAAVESALIQNANRSGYSAREAGPGEFSARAFLAGRIGLLEAEGIAALISARNDVELQAAQQLQANPLGTLSVELADRLTRILGLVEAGIDFSDEEQVVAMPVGTLRTELGAIIIQLQETLAHTHGSEATYGLPSVVLVGPPNAGKSTLFNALLGRPRMIVSNRAGTTRDTPAERCALREREIILVDTAGIDGAGGSEIEHKAQLATQRALRSSDLLIMCSPHDEEPITPASDWSTHQVLNVATRIDLAPGKPIPQGTCGVSGVDGTGLNDLRAAIEDRLSASTWASVESALRLLPRHLAALDLAHSALVAAIERLRRDAEDSGPSQAELLAEHIRVALNAIASLEGGGDPEEVLGVVFSSFCVGK